MTDPANQLEWLEQVLETSLQNNEKVGILLTLASSNDMRT